VRWVAADGARVKKGDLVAEIETDKAVVEIEAPADGILAQSVTQIGQVVKMGGTIGVVKAN
jgi:2-oxoisovalerate dehydrogenase E1 component